MNHRPPNNTGESVRESDVDRELEAPPITTFVTTAVEREVKAELPFMFNEFYNLRWGRITEAQFEHNSEACRKCFVPIHAVYPLYGGEPVHVLNFVCECGQWGQAVKRRDVLLACFERELLLCTCPCAWKDVPASLQPVRFPMLQPEHRQCLVRLILHVFNTEKEHYEAASEPERADHVLRCAALVEGWLNDTPEPVKVMEDAIGLFRQV